MKTFYIILLMIITNSCGESTAEKNDRFKINSCKMEIRSSWNNAKYRYHNEIGPTQDDKLSFFSYEKWNIILKSEAFDFDDLKCYKESYLDSFELLIMKDQCKCGSEPLPGITDIDGWNHETSCM